MTFLQSSVSWLIKTNQCINFCSSFIIKYIHNTMKMTITFDDIQELNQKHVYIKDRDSVIKIINNLIEDGVNNLQIVSDYDMTLTKQHDNGYQHVTSFGMIHKCSSIPDSYLIEERKLYNKYRPIEIDPHMTHEEKFKHMIDWWSASERLLTGLTLAPQEFDMVARQYNPALRDGTPDMMEDLSRVNVPVLVFSAGLGDSVVAVLKHNKVLYPNVKVISNYLEIDEKNIVRGYKNKMITVLNKNEQVLEGTDYYELVKDRGNVILMGDHIGDAGMAEGVPHQKSILKIGFLYDRVEECLPAYMDAFDIVLVDDQTMNVTRAILKYVFNKS